RAGLAMYFVTLPDDGLMEIADAIVQELEIEWFFNIQLVGERVIEVNPRISTVVYQEDLNLPWLGVKRALGEISDEELATMRTRVRPGRTALRYYDQVEWDEVWKTGIRCECRSGRPVRSRRMRTQSSGPSTRRSSS